MSKKLYVGNLVYEVDEAALRDLFSPFGTLTSAQIITFRDTGRSKGFGFVEFESEEDAAKAIEALNGQDHQGRRIVVSEARPMEPRQPGSRPNDRGGRGYNDRPRENQNDQRGNESRTEAVDPDNEAGFTINSSDDFTGNDDK